MQVAVDNYHGIACRMIEACAECGLVAEIAAEVDNLVVRVARQKRFYDFAGTVLGTIVYENELVFNILEFFFENAVGFCNDFFFVKDWNNDR